MDIIPMAHTPMQAHRFFDGELETWAELWAQREREADARGESRLPSATLRDVRRSGLLSAPVPRALGGAEASLSSMVRVVRRIARGAPATALSLTMPLGNAANARICDHAVAPPLREALARGRHWIAQRAAQGQILAVANSEPGAGGDLTNTKTRAWRDSEGCMRLTGRKSFATLGPDADYFLCSARCEDGSLDAFFVPRSGPGVVLDGDWNALGMRTSASMGLCLDAAPVESVFVYPGAIVGANARHWSTLLLAAVFVGLGEGALDAAVRSASKTSPWVRATLAECALTLDAAAGFVDAVAHDDAIPCPSEHAERCRRAKTFAARSALETATRAAVVAGGRAYRPDHEVARYLRDAAAGPLLRPPLPQAMDAIAARLFDDA